MKRRTRAIVPIGLLLTMCLVVPVSAFYFDFQYFETDKLVYEVGETINMVAKLIADFSTQGWCYVSFAVVTDLGPSFADEYFISPSPNVRYLNSSYTILPEHTSPNATGAQVFVIFNVEIFDTVSQGAGDNIEISIVRGHLEVNPQSSLSIYSGLDTALSFRVRSIYNESIAYSDEQVSIHVENMSSQTVLNTTQLTSTEGLVTVNWTESLGPPGLYNMTLSSEGNEDFLPFAESFQISVLPALSNLSIVSAPSSIPCQSPDGNYVEQADIIVTHTELDLSPVEDSILSWDTSFGSGLLVNQGNGMYSTSIPFQTSPRSELVNITATNSRFQTIQKSVPIEVLPNSLQFTPLMSQWNVTRGNNITIGFVIGAELDWGQTIQIQFVDEDNEITFGSNVQPGITSYLEISAEQDYSTGPHIMNVSAVSSYYQFQSISQFILGIFGTISPDIEVDSAFYGQSLNFTAILVDENNESINLIDLLLYCDDASIPFSFINHVNSSVALSVSLPLWISPGLHNFTFKFKSDYLHSTNYSMTIQVWMSTNLSIVVTSSVYRPIIDLSSSSGSIMRPPPIFLNGTISTAPLTARSTSLDN